VLVLYIPAGRLIPGDAGYSAAAAVSIVVLGAALVASTLFAVLPGDRPPGQLTRPGSRPA
jgi:hypothetical protein